MGYVGLDERINILYSDCIACQKLVGFGFGFGWPVVERIKRGRKTIFDIKEDEKRPFILGTHFLTTAKAVIKFDKLTIALRFGKNKVGFKMRGKNKTSLEKEMEFDQRRSKNFNNGFPIPKKGNVDLKTKEESCKDV
nr:hypothetical protein [Tanacetum cinerariifolium]